MNRFIKNIPNSITCLNLLGGVIAIIFATDGYEKIGSLEAWQWAAICIAVSAVADFLDGFSARLLGAFSNLGKELDSLCDLVSFGVAPAIIMFHLISQTPSAPDWLKWTVLIIPIAGALRLAKFNIDTRQSSSFIGLPIPANAIFWIGIAAILSSSSGASLLYSPMIFTIIVVIESWLMVSPLRLFSLKFKSFSWKGNEARYLLISAAIILVALLGVAGLASLIIFYIILSTFPFTQK
ncbi:MAG: CDP-diacylglycerol--serine O-phosphatidyltransferase [Muribaculaceae bacterium]|nr:CDP-diacylglycerol--serine O-phosphatidyltransferase [Muribaculaceae bacterium]